MVVLFYHIMYDASVCTNKEFELVIYLYYIKITNTLRKISFAFFTIIITTNLVYSHKRGLEIIACIHTLPLPCEGKHIIFERLSAQYNKAKSLKL